MVAAFGAKRVDAITSADILTALGPQWLARPATSRRVLQRVRMIFEWCTAQGYCAGDNPTQGLTKVLPKHRGTPRHHAALPYPAVPAFLRTLRAAEASEASRLAFEFLILTAARTSEVLLAMWSEVDLETRTWTIPGARMKSGRAHSVPLAPRVLEILHRAKGLSDGGPYVFPGRAPTKPLWNMVLLILLRRPSGTTSRCTGSAARFGIGRPNARMCRARFAKLSWPTRSGTRPKRPTTARISLTAGET